MKNGAFWAGLLTGAVIGAAVALIYAPKPGHETRGDVAEGVRKFKQAAAERGRHMLRGTTASWKRSAKRSPNRRSERKQRRRAAKAQRFAEEMVLRSLREPLRLRVSAALLLFPDGCA